MNPALPLPVEVGLAAAIIALAGEDPRILVTTGAVQDDAAALPSGPFSPIAHRTFEIGLRSWVSEQTGFDLGYVEQLYTFGDRGRHARAGDRDPHTVSVGYLALTRMPGEPGTDMPAPSEGARFRSWYGFFPWEDWRAGRPPVLDNAILPSLRDWASRAAPSEGRALPRRERVQLLFADANTRFDEENVLERYELLYEAGLVQEARRDGREAAAFWTDPPALGQPMSFDHRRILATAMGRLRAKLKYRPVIFELMPAWFTLTDLQRSVEAISGRHLHKQNFRRLVETSAVVEATGDLARDTGGRPAAMYRFRRESIVERRAAGLRLSGRA